MGAGFLQEGFCQHLVHAILLGYTEGFNLWSNNDGRVSFRITPKPYKKVEGHLCGKKTDLDLLKKAINEDNEDFKLGQAELLYREGVYYLHVPIQQDVSVRDKKDSETIVGVDINEGNISVTALDRETLDTLGTLVLDYGDVKRVRQKLHDVVRRCQEHDKTSMRNKVSSREGRYTNWVLHRLSRIVVEFSQKFPKPVVVF
ncbi:MAG: hypothetical protein ABEK59_09810 [Halobacteria archaeon]